MSEEQIPVTHVVDIPTGDGKTVRTYTVHQFSPLDGRKILAGYPLAVLAKEHTYANNEIAMRQLLKYCSAEVDGVDVHLIDDGLINTLVPDWWTLVQLEFACLKFNCTFLEGTDLFEVAKTGMTNMLKQLVAEHLERISK